MQVEDGAIVTDCYLGPNVVVGANTTVTNCTLRDTIIGDRCRITTSTLRDSMIGDAVVLEGVTGSVTLGENCEIRPPQL